LCPACLGFYQVRALDDDALWRLAADRVATQRKHAQWKAPDGIPPWSGQGDLLRFSDELEQKLLANQRRPANAKRAANLIDKLTSDLDHCQARVAAATDAATRRAIVRAAASTMESDILPFSSDDMSADKWDSVMGLWSHMRRLVDQHTRLDGGSASSPMADGSACRRSPPRHRRR